MNYRTFELITCEPWGAGNIAVFCRERTEGDGHNPRRRIDVLDFDPYFYIHESQEDKAREMMEDEIQVKEEQAIIDVRGGFRSRLTGHDLVKIVMSKPGQTPILRDEFDSPDDTDIESWESDINFTMRFRVDTDIKGVFRIPECMLKGDGYRLNTSWTAFEPVHDDDPEIPVRNMYFDIEVGGYEQTTPEDDDLNPISCVTVYDNYEDELITWIWRDDFEDTESEITWSWDPDESYVPPRSRVLEVLGRKYREYAESIADLGNGMERDQLKYWVGSELMGVEFEIWMDLWEGVVEEQDLQDGHEIVWELEDRLDEEMSRPQDPEMEYDWTIRRWESERKMLGNFFSHWTDRRYDLMSGWYSDKYDVPYLVERAEELGIDPSMWSEMGEVDSGLPVDSWGQANVGGAFMNDLERRYDNIVGPQSSALDHVAAVEEEIMSWEQESGSIQDLWNDDPMRMMEYNANDVIATMKVDEKAGVTDFFLEKMYMTGCRVEEIEQDSNVITYYLMFEAHDDEIIPRAKVRTHKKFGGGRVLLPEKQGVMGPIGVLDLSKIYPSIMITLGLSYENVTGVDPIKFGESLELKDKIPDIEKSVNDDLFQVVEKKEGDPDEIIWDFQEGDVVSPLALGKKGRKEIWDLLWDMQPDGSLERRIDWEFIEPEDQYDWSHVLPDDHTIDREHEGTRLPNGVRVDQDHDGIITRTLKKMFKLRYKFGDAAEALDPSRDDYKEVYDRLMQKRQNMKDQINAVFGYAGYKKSPLFRPEIAMTTTFVGRNILKMCEEVAIDLGHVVRYGDTDSIMVELQGDIYDPQENLDACVYEGHRVGELVNAKMDDFAENFCNIGRDDHRFELEFEKLYSTMFIGDKKKRYAGLKTVTE